MRGLLRLTMLTISLVHMPLYSEWAGWGLCHLPGTMTTTDKLCGDNIIRQRQRTCQLVDKCSSDPLKTQEQACKRECPQDGGIINF